MRFFFKPKKKKSLLADFAFETIKCNQRDPPCRFRLKVSFYFYFLIFGHWIFCEIIALEQTLLYFYDAGKRILNLILTEYVLMVLMPYLVVCSFSVIYVSYLSTSSNY